MKRYLLFFVVFLGMTATSQLVLAQQEQQVFLNGKQSYNEGKYSFAMESFKQLADPNATHAFKEYASFYFALSAYKNGDIGLARSMWLQIESKYPRWNQMDEVYHWLAEAYSVEGDLKKSIAYGRKIKGKTSDGVVNHHLASSSDYELLRSIYEDYPEDKVVASALAGLISRQTMSNRDFKLIQKLIQDFGFSRESFGLPNVGKSILKETYNVAVLLPFMFDGLENTSKVERNNFVMDIYRGILQAALELNSKKKVIEIFPYDTRRSKAATKELLLKEEMKDMDLVIGPLYPDPSRLTSEFCFKNKINMINPVSSNSAVIDNNPFSFLIKPTHELQSLKAAELAVDSLSVRTKNAYVFYNSNEKDSIMARLYTDKIAKDTFDIAYNVKIDDEKLQKAYQVLTETYEWMLTEEEADSIGNIPGRIIKEGKLKMEEEDEEDSVYLYEERFVIEWDSIGHIYLASSEPLHASMFISAVETRGDKIPIIGRYDWLNYDMLNVDQLERIGVYFISPDYVDRTSDTFRFFRSNYHKAHKKEPSLNAMLGYELMMYTGSMMKEYGHYFQNGSIQEGFSKGKVFHGFNYNFSNSNQVVPIIRFKDSGFELVNYQYDSKE
ncbi:MAG: hypothetical protein JXQ96_11790 [Cyclobacteriaceae bacterium]